MRNILYKLATVLLIITANVFSQTATQPQGDGSDVNPYRIATLNNLYWITQNSSSWGSFFNQTADIDASSTSGWDSGNGFLPIGNGTTSFGGTYDGNGHTITGLFIRRWSTNYVGMFGYSIGGTIKNIGVIGVNISGNTYVGGLVGDNNSSSTVSNSYSTGSVSGTTGVGGLVGWSVYSIINSYSTGSVSGTTGVGGLVGYSSGTVSNSYSTGNVNGAGDYFGGLVGYNSGTVSNSFWDTQTSGRSSSAGGTGKTTTAMKTESTFTDAGWDFNTTPVWEIDGVNYNGYPYLAWQVVTSAPTTQTSSIAFSSVTSSGMTISWTNGNGSKRAVFAKQASSGTTSPSNSTNYSANTTLGSGTQIGSTGWYCVYNGTGTSVSIVGLSPTTDYIVQSFEYTGSTGGEFYMTSIATNNPNTQQTIALTAPATQASSITFSSVASTQMTIGWTNGDGEKRAVFVKQASSGTTSSVDNTTYSANTVLGSGDQIGSTGWYCVYNGTGSSVAVTGLSPSTAYMAQVFEYNGASGSEKYLTTTATDNPKSQTTTAYTNYVLKFDGTDDYVLIAHNSSLNLTTAMTVEAWIKTTSTSEEYILEKTENAYYFGINLAGNAGKISMYLVGVNSGWLYSNNTTINDGSWHHVAAAYDGANEYLYVDGVLDNSLSVSGTIGTNGDPLYIGSRDGGSVFGGQMDEVRLWNVARSGAQIRSAMHCTLTGSESGIVGYWQFDEGTGSTAYDKTSNGNNGTLTNFNFNSSSGWVSSTAPLGPGTNTSTTSFTSGTASLGTVSLTTTDAFDNAVDLYSTKISGAPNSLPSGSSTVLNDRYWIVNVFGTPGTFAGNMTFTVPSTFTNNGAASASNYTLYHRNSNDDGTWTSVGTASGLTATTITFNNITSFSQFSLGTNDPLPVELVSFIASIKNNVVELQWQTATEVNNYGFEIECKLKNGNWNKIGFVQGAGNSNSPKSYSFTNNNVRSGVYIYRLKQIDIDGSYKYSNEIEVILTAPKEFSLSQNFPNPFNPTTIIKYSIPNSEKVLIKVYDVLGREVKTLLDEYKDTGTYEIEFNASNLTSGLYFYKITSGKYSEVKKMLLVR